MDQAFRNLLLEKRDAIASAWRERTLSTYSPEAARFMATDKDAFSNPVGTTLARVLEACLDELIAGELAEGEPFPLVDDVMRVRAVQTFRPAKAVGFFFLLKDVVREEIDVAKLDAGLFDSLLELESRIDQLVLQAFDAYLACRERVYEIKATELRRRSERVVSKLNERLFARAKEREDSEGGDSR